MNKGSGLKNGTSGMLHVQDLGVICVSFLMVILDPFSPHKAYTHVLLRNLFSLPFFKWLLQPFVFGLNLRCGSTQHATPRREAC